METHFPSCVYVESTAGENAELNHPYSRAKISFIENIITKEKIAGTIKSFKLNKSPGTDGIYLQRGGDGIIISRIEWIFKGAVHIGYIPDEWKEARHVFISKVGKTGHIFFNFSTAGFTYI